MAKNESKGGRVTAKGTRPAGGRPRAERHPADDLIDDAARSLRKARSAVDVEIFGSVFAGQVRRLVTQAARDGDAPPPVGQLVLLRCAERADRVSLLVTAVLTAILEGDDLAAALDITDALVEKHGVPEWLEGIGSAEPTRAWHASDVFGDADSFVVGFRYPGDDLEHAAVVLADNSVGGQATDVWVAMDPDDVVARWVEAGGEEERIGEMPLADALVATADALARAAAHPEHDDLREETFFQHAALIEARLRRRGVVATTAAVPDTSDSTIDGLVAEFLASAERETVPAAVTEDEVRVVVTEILRLRAAADGEPLRWSPMLVPGFLITAVRVRLYEHEQLPDILRAVVRWAGAWRGVGEHFVDRVLASVDEQVPTIMRLRGSPSDPVEALDALDRLEAAGVDLEDADLVHATLEEETRRTEDAVDPEST